MPGQRGALRTDRRSSYSTTAPHGGDSPSSDIVGDAALGIDTALVDRRRTPETLDGKGRVRVEQGVDSGDARCGGRAPAVTLDMARVVCVEKQVMGVDE